MLTQERKAVLLNRLERDGRVVAKAESHRLGVSEDTIRRDLRELASEGLLQRVHGGALPASKAMIDFTGREQVASEGKAAIGRTSARMVQSGQIIFLDGGTTAVQLARNLPHDLSTKVVTHSPSIAVELARNPRIEVEVIGGALFKHSIVCVGAAAAEAISRVRADVYFMGITGVHADIGLTTGDAEEACVKRLISQQAAETVALASNEKLGAVSPYLVLPALEVGTIVVEADASLDQVEALEKLGVVVVRSSARNSR